MIDNRYVKHRKVGIVTLVGALMLSCDIRHVISKPTEVLHKIVLEDNEYISCPNQIIEIKDGEDAIFNLKLEYLATVSDCTYENYQIEYISDSEALLTLKDVEYSCFVSLTSSYDALDDEDEFEVDDVQENKTVTFVENPDIILDQYQYTVPYGERLVVNFQMAPEACVLNVSYRKHKTIYKGDNHYILVLHNIRDNLNISFTTTKESVNYDCNEGRYRNEVDRLTMPITHSHLRINSAIGSKYMFRPGYYQIGWNTAQDYSGEFISFGSRFSDNIRTLYAQWEQYSSTGLFSYEEGEKTVCINRYIGDEERACIPQFINRKPVTTIKKGAFSNEITKCLIIPDTVKNIEDGAFENSVIDELYISDNLTCISESLFGKHQLKTIHISAISAPINSGTYYDAFQDKLDYLDSIKDEKKIILFGGSSTRYGFYSEPIMNAFPEYKVVNMGVYAYVSAKIQLDVIRHYLKPGDIVLDSPEFDSLECQFFYDDYFDIRLLNMFESNYDSLSYIDLTKYKYPLNNMSVHFEEKKNAQPKNYEIQAKRFDDDMNRYNYDTYNKYGDFTLDRPDNPEDAWISQELCEYTPGRFEDYLFDSYNSVYKELKNDGVQLLFTYAPKNMNCLTYNSSQDQINALDELIRQKIECPVISNIWDSLMQGYYFYLIDNHLSNNGASIRTTNVIEDLRNYFSKA